MGDFELEMKDEFHHTNHYSYDYVIVFNVFREEDQVTAFQQKNSMKKILERLAESGLETKMFYSVQRDEVYCKVRCSLLRLKKEADRIDFKMLLDPKALETLAQRGVPEKNVNPITLENSKGITHRAPYSHIYGKYDMEDRLQRVYQKSEGLPHPFSMTNRLKLMLSIMEARHFEGGADMSMTELVAKKAIMAFYPLHDDEAREELKEKWITWVSAPWSQPLWEIKSYFGEKIGLYFAWLGHYTTWLIVPSFVGFWVFVNVSADKNNPNAVLVPYFAGFMALWSTFFLEYWKRKNATLAMEWGMVGYEEEEGVRPEYDGEKISDPVNGQEVLWVDPSIRFRKLAKSQVIIATAVITVIAAVTSIFILRRFLTTGSRDESLGGNGGAIAGMANALQIQIMSHFYGDIAIKLNDYENHRTDTQYEDNLIAKNFMFQFVNSYASLVYIAFIKNAVGDECVPTCMSELGAQLGTIFVTRLVTGNITEILVPKVLAWKKARSEMAGVDDPSRSAAKAEQEFSMAVYDEMMGTFGDYLEMIIQFGYVTLFVSAFPLAPAFALANNYVEIRIDGWKLVVESRRPRPTGAEDIGTWYSILEIMATIAVVTNTAIVCFTGTFMSGYTDRHRVWSFIFMEHALFFTKYVFALIVDDVPEDVTLQLGRQTFLCDKLIDLVADDNDEDLISGNKLRVDLTIHDRDDVY